MPASFILATHAAGAHVLPLIPVARELVRRGHDVWWYTGERYRDRVESCGARYVAPRFGRFLDFERAEHDNPEFAALTGADRAAWFLRNVFAEPAAGQYRDLSALFSRTGADVLLADSGLWAANLLHELEGTLWATVCQAPMSLPDPDRRPYAGEDGDRAMEETMRLINAIRTGLALPPMTPGTDRSTPYLFIQATVPCFELPRRALPPHVHFVGPLFPDPPERFTPPPWWPDCDDDRPVGLGTQGTSATTPGELITPAVMALADTDALVVVTGGRDDVDVGVSPLPANVRTASFLPYDRLMPKLDAVVATGGYGTVQLALAHGLPLVVSGRTEDKPAVCARVAHCGAGIHLDSGRPEPAQIAAAVRAVLTEPGYRQAARRMAAEYTGYDAPGRTADLLERLARERGPVTSGRPVGVEAR